MVDWAWRTCGTDSYVICFCIGKYWEFQNFYWYVLAWLAVHMPDLVHSILIKGVLQEILKIGALSLLDQFCGLLAIRALLSHFVLPMDGFAR